MKIKIEKIVYPGKGLGRGEDGIATFVEGALEGETAEVAVTKSKKTFKEARLEAVIEPSPRRIPPKCDSYGKCGGCSLQHTDYDDQVRIKETYVKELLEKICPNIQPCVKSPSQWNYRNKMEFSFFFARDASPDLGLHEKNEFNRYFPVPPCHICGEDFLFVTAKIKEFAKTSGLSVYDKRSHEGFFRHLVIRKGIRSGQMLVNLVVSRGEFPDDMFSGLIGSLKEKVSSFYLTINSSVSDAVQADEIKLLYGAQTISEFLEIKGRHYEFSISPFSFFQTNTLGTEKLYETVIELASLSATDTVLDLYCGTGTIGIILAPYVKKVLGVEQVEQAVLNANVNRGKNNVSNIAFEAGTLEKWVKGMVPTDFSVIVIDPPRAGLTEKVVDFVIKCSPERIVYVSCNPATLARDLAELDRKGEYRAVKAVPVDMFPQTFHIETVVLLEKKHG